MAPENCKHLLIDQIAEDAIVTCLRGQRYRPVRGSMANVGPACPPCPATAHDSETPGAQGANNLGHHTGRPYRDGVEVNRAGRWRRYEVPTTPLTTGVRSSPPMARLHRVSPPASPSPRPGGCCPMASVPPIPRPISSGAAVVEILASRPVEQSCDPVPPATNVIVTPTWIPPPNSDLRRAAYGIRVDGTVDGSGGTASDDRVPPMAAASPAAARVTGPPSAMWRPIRPRTV